jgi:uncharacterized Fe-S cluster-containing radical SAM superfamily protein
MKQKITHKPYQTSKATRRAIKVLTLDRKKLYRFPWSKTDNPGGWVEVTDECNLHCPGCYRHRLEGHRPLAAVKEDVLSCRELTNCDRMGIAGGEPLIYPHIVEVVEFIAKHKMKPMLLTNGEHLTRELAIKLKKAGLAKFHFHVDSGMKRPGWTGKTEKQLNELRQHFADFVWDLEGLQCGFNITIFPSTVKYLPDIVAWSRKNIHKVQHISLVAYRAIPLIDSIQYSVNGEKINPGVFQHSTTNPGEISLTATGMFQVVASHFPGFQPCAYLNGSVDPGTYKFLITLQVGSKKKLYGVLGPKTAELAQMFFHFFKKRYFEFQKSPAAGKKLFLLSLFDSKLRKAFFNFLAASVKNPLRLLDRIYVQSISLQQPNEYLEGEANTCDSCVNMMVYQGKLINSCRLDEYRMFGGPLKAQLKKDEKSGTQNVGIKIK